MDANKERFVAYTLLCVLFLVGVACYAAFPVEEPDQPIRLMYQTNAGKVLFDHKVHMDEDAYGLSCTDCHHYSDVDTQAVNSCTDCHEEDDDTYTMENFGHRAHFDPDEIGLSCEDCHDAAEVEGSAHASCSSCHSKDGEEYSPKRSDAFHLQCIGCHEDAGSGPVDCNECHASV